MGLHTRPTATKDDAVCRPSRGMLCCSIVGYPKRTGLLFFGSSGKRGGESPVLLLTAEMPWPIVSWPG